MRKRGQLRKANQRKIRSAIGAAYEFPIDMPSRKKAKNKPKQPTQTQRAKLRKSLQKAGLHKTRAQRVSERKTFKEAYGYEQPRLSMAVGTRRADGTIKPGKASKYTVKKRSPVYEVETEMRPGERKVRRNMFGGIKRNFFGDIIYDYGPDRKVVTKKKLVGEKFTVRKVTKGKTAKKGSSRSVHGIRLGSARSIRSRIKANPKKKKKKGQKAKKEKKKKKKK